MRIYRKVLTELPEERREKIEKRTDEIVQNLMLSEDLSNDEIIRLYDKYTLHISIKVFSELYEICII